MNKNEVDHVHFSGVTSVSSLVYFSLSFSLAITKNKHTYTENFALFACLYVF